MDVKRWVLAGCLLVVAATTTVVLADEKVDVIGAPAQEDEWIASVPGERAKVWAFGDANPPNSERVGRLIRRADPDRVLYLGDVYPVGDADDFDRWADALRGLIRRMAPTPGNHEWELRSEGYEPFWREVTGETPPPYYSFRVAGWEVLSVNSEVADRGATVDWLEDQARPGGNCRIAFWHRPRHSAGKYRDGHEAARAYWDALAGRARIIVNAHDHNMQRLKQRDSIVQFISGAGGRHRHGVNEGARILAFGNDKNYGALRLNLSPGRAAWRFVAVGGRVLDRGSLRCRA